MSKTIEPYGGLNPCNKCRHNFDCILLPYGCLSYQTYIMEQKLNNKQWEQ